MQPSNGFASSSALLLSGKVDLAPFDTDWALAYNEKASAKDKLRFLVTFGAQRHREQEKKEKPITRRLQKNKITVSETRVTLVMHIIVSRANEGEEKN